MEQRAVKMDEEKTFSVKTGASSNVPLPPSPKDRKKPNSELPPPIPPRPKTPLNIPAALETLRIPPRTSQTMGIPAIPRKQSLDPQKNYETPSPVPPRARSSLGTSQTTGILAIPAIKFSLQSAPTTPQQLAPERGRTLSLSSSQKRSATPGSSPRRQEHEPATPQPFTYERGRSLALSTSQKRSATPGPSSREQENEETNSGTSTPGGREKFWTSLRTRLRRQSQKPSAKTKLAVSEPTTPTESKGPDERRRSLWKLFNPKSSSKQESGSEPPSPIIGDHRRSSSIRSLGKPENMEETFGDDREWNAIYAFSFFHNSDEFKILIKYVSDELDPKKIPKIHPTVQIVYQMIKNAYEQFRYKQEASFLTCLRTSMNEITVGAHNERLDPTSDVLNEKSITIILEKTKETIDVIKKIYSHPFFTDKNGFGYISTFVKEEFVDFELPNIKDSSLKSFFCLIRNITRLYETAGMNLEESVTQCITVKTMRAHSYGEINLKNVKRNLAYFDYILKTLKTIYTHRFFRHEKEFDQVLEFVEKQFVNDTLPEVKNPGIAAFYRAIRNIGVYLKTKKCSLREAVEKCITIKKLRELGCNDINPDPIQGMLGFIDHQLKPDPLKSPSGTPSSTQP